MPGALSKDLAELLTALERSESGLMATDETERQYRFAKAEEAEKFKRAIAARRQRPAPRVPATSARLS
jgi:hypothetical protein